MAVFYVREALANEWSRAQLEDAVESGLYSRKSKALDNFTERLPEGEGRLVRELVKSPYVFGFTETVDAENERAVEKALVRNITRTLTELGNALVDCGRRLSVVESKGTAFIGE